MERGKRVDLIMNSHLFKEELEKIVEQQLQGDFGAVNLLSLSQLYSSIGLPQRFHGALLKGRLFRKASI